MSPIHSIISIAALVASIALTILSIANFALAGDAIHAIDNTLPEGRSERYWLIAGYNKTWTNDHHIMVVHNNTGDMTILVATALSFVAGISGIAWFFTARKNKTPSFFSVMLSLVASPIAFIVAVASSISTAAITKAMAQTSCDPLRGLVSGTAFACTRELLVCTVSPNFVETYFDDDRFCRETKSMRMMLVPFAVLSAVLMGLYVARVCVGDKNDSEERVHRLLNEEKVDV